MENSQHVEALAELPREEALARLYQLQHQLSIEQVLLLDSLTLLPEGFCDDCHAHGARRRYGRVDLCDRCTLARLAVAAVASSREAGELA